MRAIADKTMGIKGGSYCINPYEVEAGLKDGNYDC